MFKLGKFRKLNSPKPIRIKCLDCHSRHSLGEKRGRPDRVRETSGRGCQFSPKLGRARRSGGEVAWEQPRARRPGGAGDPAGCGRTPLPLRHLGRFAPEPSALCCAFQLQPRPPPFWSLVTGWGNSSSRRSIASPPKQPHLPPCCCPAVFPQVSLRRICKTTGPIPPPRALQVSRCCLPKAPCVETG